MDDLRADEVQVREDGKPCAIRSFRLVQAEGGGPASAPGAGPVTLPAAKPEAETARPTPTGDGLVSVVALVFDQLGTEAARNARAAALQLADRSFPNGSVFAVLKVGQGLAVLQSFTEDRALLPAAVEKATTGTDQARDPARRAGFDNATEEALSLARQAQAAARNKEPDARLRAMEAQMLLFSDSVTREGQGQASLQPLLAIARALSLVQGRKSLLYFSEGLAVPPSVEDLFQSMVSTANRSNVSVYAFDTRGLRVRSPTEETKLALDLARETAFSDQVGGAVPDEAVPTLGIDPSEMSRRPSPQPAGRATGPRGEHGWVPRGRDERPPPRARARGGRPARVLRGRLRPAHPKGRRPLAPISVKVSRPGVVVRTRRGYYALPPGAPVVLPYELALAEALAASPMPHDVEHRAATLRFAGGEAQTETLVWVEVPLAGLALTPGETTYRGHVSLLAQVKDETGTLVARLSHDAPIEGPLAEARERARADHGGPADAPPSPGAIRPRDGGPGPPEAVGSAPGVPRRDSRARPVAQPGQRRDRARRRGGRGRARPGRPSSRGPFARDPASRPVVPRGNTGRLALLQPLRRFRRSPPGGEARVPPGTGRSSRGRSPSCPRPTPAGGSPTSGASRPAASSRAFTRSGCVAGRETPRPRRPPRSRSLPGHRSPPRLFAPSTAIEDRENVAIPLTAILERASRYVQEGAGTFRDLVADESSTRWSPTERRTRTGGAPSAPTWSSSASGVRCPGARSATSTRSTGRRCATGRGSSRLLRAEGAGGRTGEGDPGRGGALTWGLRSVNAPTLGLLFLHRRRRTRLSSFKRKGTRAITGSPRWRSPSRRSSGVIPGGQGRRAGERAVLDQRHPGHGPAHGDRVRPGAEDKSMHKLQRVE